MAAGWSGAVGQSRGGLGWCLAAATVAETKASLQVQTAMMIERITETTQETKAKQQLKTIRSVTLSKYKSF